MNEKEAIAIVNNRLIKAVKLLYLIEFQSRECNNYDKLECHLGEFMALNKLGLTAEGLKAIAKIPIDMDNYEQGK